MPRTSFRSLAGRVYPRANGGKRLLPAAAAALAVAAAGGCGGGGAKPPETRVVRGAGFSFAAPAEWRVERAPTRVSAAPREDDVALVGVSTYRLLKPFRPALFAAATRELDERTAQLARTLDGRVAASRTVRVAGARSRQYDVAAGETTQRLTYLLRGRREYLLTCRYATGEDDPLDGACARFLASFRLAAPPAAPSG